MKWESLVVFGPCEAMRQAGLVTSCLNPLFHEHLSSSTHNLDTCAENLPLEQIAVTPKFAKLQEASFDALSKSRYSAS